MEILSPYPHDLNGQGTDCASDCPACNWFTEQELQSTLAILSSPDFPALLKLAIDRAVTRVIAQQDESRLDYCAAQQSSVNTP